LVCLQRSHDRHERQSLQEREKNEDVKGKKGDKVKVGREVAMQSEAEVEVEVAYVPNYKSNDNAERRLQSAFPPFSQQY
jgi:hypothetical protein